MKAIRIPERLKEWKSFRQGSIPITKISRRTCRSKGKNKKGSAADERNAEEDE
jgi:hypothetical protein